MRLMSNHNLNSHFPGYIRSLFILMMGLMLLTSTLSSITAQSDLPTAVATVAATPAIPVTATTVVTETAPTAASPSIVTTAATPELPDLVRSSTLELASLETFRSDFVLNAPTSAFSRVTLTINQNGQAAPNQVIEVDLDQIAEITSPFTAFTHLWTADGDNPLALFQNVTFTWSFTLISGETAFVSKSVIYADPRTEWVLDAPADSVVKIAAPVGRYDLASLQSAIQNVYALLRTSTGQTTANLAVVIFDGQIPVDPCQTVADGKSVITALISGVEIPCNASNITRIYTTSNYIPLQLLVGSVEEAQDSITRVLFDALYDQVWAEAEIPVWFRYGLREFYTPGIKLNNLVISRDSVRLNRAIASMEVVPQDNRLTAWQAQSYGMVQYMAEQIGIQALFQLARQVDSEVALESLYQQASGKPLASIIPAWSNWIYTRAAELAYQYTPYLPTTPTPEPTRTRTLTPTIPPTLTLTPSITPTITGEMSATPSDTPTETLVPTFTVTPRPAGSLFTPTPVPVTAVLEGENGGIAVLLVGIIAVIAVVVAGVLLMLLRRRPS